MMARELSSGTVLNRRYQIEALISKSGKARTYRASDARFPDRRWIVKVFESPPKQNFDEEMRLLLGLNHDNLIPVVDYFQEDQIFSVVEAYVEGESLEERLLRGSRPVERQILSWGIQAVDALLYLHRQLKNFSGYRDFSPRKIIVSEAGEVKIIPSFSSLWDDKSAGIVGFTAPELFEQEKTPDERSDVYSAAAVIHRAFAGEFQSQIPFVFAPVSSENPNLRSPIEHVLEKALEEDPGTRHQSLLEFRDELMKCLETVFAAHQKSGSKQMPLTVEWILISVLAGLAVGAAIAKTHLNLSDILHMHGWR